MNRLLISGIALFAVYLIRLIVVFGNLANEVLEIILALAKWGLWVWFIVELIIYLNKRKGNGNLSPSRNKKPFHKRWLISLIVAVVGSFFAFAIFMGDKPGMSESSILILVWTTFLIYVSLMVWLLVESVIFSRKNKNTLPLSLITIFFVLNVLFALLIQILYNALNLPVPGFIQNGRGYFFLFSALIFLGLSVWTVMKSVTLLRSKEDVNLGIVNLIVGGITILVSLWFIWGAFFIFSSNSASVVSPVRSILLLIQ